MTVYVRYELLRTFRNRRFFIFSFGFPLVLYFLIAGAEPATSTNLGGIGHLRAALLHGRPRRVRHHERDRLGAARASPPSAVGWNRQLRLTPLSTRTYFRTKVLTGYVMALVHARAALRRRQHARRAPERRRTGSR